MFIGGMITVIFSYNTYTIIVLKVHHVHLNVNIIYNIFSIHFDHRRIKHVHLWVCFVSFIVAIVMFSLFLHSTFSSMLSETGGCNVEDNNNVPPVPILNCNIKTSCKV